MARFPFARRRSREQIEHEAKQAAIKDSVTALVKAASANGPVMPGSQFQGGWNNLGNASMAMVQRVSQNMAQQFDVPIADIEAELVQQGLTWGPPFPPGRPLDPFFGYRRPPRTRDFQVGENVQLTPRWNRVSFKTLKAIYDAYDIPQVCVRRLINDVRTLDYSFVPLRGERDDVSGDIEQARQFFRLPDRRQPFRAWLAEYLQDVLRYDAGCLYTRRSEDGTPIAWEVVDGTTMIPLVDYYGRVAADEDDNDPPADGMAWPGGDTPGFLQIIQGMPWDWLTADDIAYQPINPLPESQYGLAPLEAVLMSANTDMRFQWHFLQYFTEGTIPAGFMEAPPDMSDPAQLTEWQETWDAVMMGDQAKLRQIRWVPSGSKFTAVKNSDFDEKFPLYLMRRVCFDDQTEILTERGWQAFPELERDVRVATRSTDGRFEWQMPTDYIALPHAGEMVAFKTSTTDVLVTPEHRMLTTFFPTPRQPHHPEVLREARRLVGRGGYMMPMTSQWEGEHPATFKLPAVGTPDHTRTGKESTRWHGPTHVPIEDWCAFLGIWLAEGHVQGSNGGRDPRTLAGPVAPYRVGISQSPNSPHWTRIEALLERLPWKFHRQAHGWTCQSVALWNYLKPLGNSRTKHLPREVLALAPDLLEIVWEWALVGDGSIDHRPPRKPQRRMITASRQLADDWQELLQKVGRDGTVRFRPAAKWTIIGRSGQTCGGVYEVRERRSTLRTLKGTSAHYDGMVYCVTVPNGVIYTRRNGKPAWAGNCAAYGVTPNDLGWTEDVNRATGETQVDVQFRVGTMPVVRHVEDVINLFIATELGLRCELQFDKGQETEDRVATAQAHKIYVEMGAEGIDEVRAELGKPIDRSRPSPRFINNPRVGPIPLIAIESLAGKIDEETYAPDKGQPLVSNPYIGAAGLIPPQGSPEQKAMGIASSQMQRDMLQDTTGEGPTPEMAATIAAASPPPAPAKTETADGSPENEDTTPQPASTPPATGAGAMPRPAVKEATAGVSAATGIQGTGLIGHGPDDDDDDEDEEQATKSLEFELELRRWRDNTRQRLRKGRAPRRFHSTVLADDTIDLVWSHLKAASSRGEVDAVFDAALGKAGARRAGDTAAGSPLRKADGEKADEHDFDGVIAGGLAVQALDTGRVLLIQRLADKADDDNAYARWELPGGRLDESDFSVWDGALREWEEETGAALGEDAQHAGSFLSPDGAYQCYVIQVPAEAGLELSPQAEEVADIGWWNPSSLGSDDRVRDKVQEMAPGLERFLKANADIGSRTGMVSLDLAPGTIPALPDGVPDHHITIVFLGSDVDDSTFAEVCERAQAVAAQTAPLTGTVGGLDTFTPSGSSDGKTPVFAIPDVPGLDALRAAFEDFNASEHTDFHPHVTLSYLEPGDPMPEPVPDTPVTFTELAVHVGDECQTFPFGQVAKDAPRQPPNLREATDPAERCGTCEMFVADRRVCWGYGDWAVTPEQTCDSWTLSPTGQDVGGSDSATSDEMAKAERPTHFHRHTDKIVAHYAPLIASALEDMFPANALHAAVQAARDAKPARAEKRSGSVPSDAAASQRAIEVLNNGLTPQGKLDAVLGDLYGDAGLQGANGAADAANGAMLSSLQSVVSQLPDGYWSDWQPGWGAAAAKDADGGLADLLAQRGITIKGIQDTTLDRLGNTIAGSIANGDSVQATQKLVQDYVSDPERSFLIADTEQARAMTAASLDTYTQNGVEQLDWIAEDDACEDCQANADASPVSIDDGFPNGDVPVHPRCFPAGTVVSGPPVVAATARPYEGDLVAIVLASGKDIAVTPHHPVLTPRGWVSAGDLHEGADVLSALDPDRVAALVHPDDHQGVARIEDVAGALRKAGAMAPVTVPVATEDFHGDGIPGHDVDVVLATRRAEFDRDAGSREQGGEIRLVGAEGTAVLTAGDGHAFGDTLFAPPRGVVRRYEHGRARLRIALVPAQGHGLTTTTRRHASFPQHASDGVAVDSVSESESLDGLAGKIALDEIWRQGDTPAPGRDASLSERRVDGLLIDAEDGRDLIRALAGLVQRDRVLSLRNVRFAGHVYNLETTDGWYCADGIIAHNCRCAVSPHIDTGEG